MRIYYIALAVLVLSFGAASYFPASEVLKGIVASPGIAALFAALYETLRTASQEQRERRVWLMNNRLRIYSSIHIAVGEVHQQMQEMAERHVTHPDRAKNIEGYFAALDKARPFMNEAFLVCEVRVKRAMLGFNKETARITHNILNESFWPEPAVAAKKTEWEPKRSLDALTDLLLTEMRLELGSKELPD